MTNQIIGFPAVNAPFSTFQDEDGKTVGTVLERPWYQFLRGMWLRIGGAVQDLVTGLLVGTNFVVMEISGFSFGVVTGTINSGNTVTVTTPVVGEAAAAVAAGASPFTYTATFQGTMIVFGGQVEFSRDSGASWILASLTGGFVPMLVGDQIRVTWFGASAPTLTFLKGGA